MSPRVRIEDPRAIRQTLLEGRPLCALLVREGARSDPAAEIVSLAQRARLPVFVESAREMRRMSIGDDEPELLAVAGSPPCDRIEDAIDRPEPIFLLAGLRYPANVGFILRAAEVAGLAAVVVANEWQGAEWEEARRVSIRADRFLPVLRETARRTADVARAAGRSILAVESESGVAPWRVDLRSPCLAVFGSEAEGLPSELLDLADHRIRIPSRGFIPSYNVQAAVSIVLGEWLRQSSENDDAASTARVSRSAR